jgi:hypothetical protein
MLSSYLLRRGREERRRLHDAVAAGSYCRGEGCSDLFKHLVVVLLLVQVATRANMTKRP